jgi:hypothetical protein
MPGPSYTPPAGNAASVNFTAPGFIPPAGNAANFNFGVDSDSYGNSSKPPGRRKQIIGT